MRKVMGLLVVLVVALSASSALGQAIPWEIKYLGNVAPDAWGSCGVWNGTSMNWNLLTGNAALGAVVDDPAAIDGKAYRVNDNSDLDRLIWRSEPSVNIDSATGATIVARVKTVSDSAGSGNIGVQGSGLASGYHWGGPNGDIVEPYRGGSASVAGDDNYHIIRLTAAGSGATVPFTEGFPYGDGALNGANDWAGNADSATIAASANTVQMTCWYIDADPANQNRGSGTPVAAVAGGDNLIVVKVKMKRGTGVGGFMWDFQAYDTAGTLMAWWYGHYNSARPRSPVAPYVGTNVVFADDDWHVLEARINTATNKTDYYIDGAFQITLDFPAAGNQMAQASFNSKANSGCIGDTVFFDDVEVYGTPVKGAGRKVKLYLDEDPTPRVEIINAQRLTADLSDTDRFRMGASDVAGTQDVYFDWVVGSAAGAFAPGEEEGLIGHSLVISPTVVTTIAGAKKAPEHAQAEMTEVSVTSVIKAYDEYYNVVPVGFTVADYQDVNPGDPYNPIYKATQGIWVVYNPDFGIGFYQGEHVKISGTCETIDGERVIVANYVEEVLTMHPALGPQAVNNRMSGGGAFGMQAALVGDVTKLTGLPAYDERFTYADGALVGKGFWTGNAGSEIGVSGNQLAISSPGAARNATQTRVLGDCGTGEISVKVKAKTGSGPNNFWTLTVLDEAGRTFGYWMGSGTFVRGRMADGTYTPEQSLGADWKTIEIKVYPSMDATEFLVDGVRLGTIFDHNLIGCGDTVGRIVLDRLQVDTTNQIVLDDLQVLPGSATDVGLSDVGMYSTIFGRVTNVDNYAVNPWDWYFYVDDGTGLRDGTLDIVGSPNIGIRCRACSADLRETDVPALGDYVSVTGTMGVTKVGGNNVRYFYTWSYKAY